MESKDGREELQSLLLKAEQYKRQMEAINRQMQMMESTMEELRGSLAALSAIEETKEGTEVLVSIGSDSFIKAKLADTGRVIVGVGSSLSMEKSVPEARKYYEARLAQATEAQEKLRKAALETADAIRDLDEEYQRVVSHVQQGKG